MQSATDGDTLLRLWERALAQPPAMRIDALLGDALLDDLAAQALTLGERNTRLASLHTQWFGRELQLLSHCPACNTGAQFSGDCDALSAAMPGAVAPTHHALIGDHRIEFRLPRAEDVVAAASSNGDNADFGRALLQRCVLACTRDGRAVPVQALPPEVLDTLSQRMEVLDPAASVCFALDCPQCATHWVARLDLAQLVWQKLQAAAERLLLDIDALARTYGWTEPDVLALSPTRRAAYVQMAAS